MELVLVLVLVGAAVLIGFPIIYTDFSILTEPLRRWYRNYKDRNG